MASLKAKLEQALGVVAATAASAPTVFYGADSDEQARPCFVCEAQQGREDDALTGLGNFWMGFRVTVKSNADIQTTENPVNDHDTRVSALLAVMQTDTLAADLSAAASGFHCFIVRNLQLVPDTQGRSFTDSFEGEAYCCGADIS